MARTVRDQKLDTRSTRLKLLARREPYWAKLGPGRHVGYRRLGREGGTWIARAYDPETRKRTYRALGAADDALDADGHEVLTFSEAQEHARAWFPRAFRSEDERHAKAAMRTVGDAVRAYLDWLDRNRKPTTAREARYAAQAHILPALGDIRLDRLTTGTLARWHEALAAAPLRVRTARSSKERRSRPVGGDEDSRRSRRATANRLLTILKAALNRAWQDGQVPSDEAWRKTRPFRGADAARARWLSIEEATRLLNACAPDFRRLVRGALLTGCRYGELGRLEVGDFDAGSGTMLIRESKSGRPRRIPLDDEGLAFFRAVTAGRAGRERVFLRDDGKGWAKDWQHRPIADASAAAGLDPPATFHVMRHTFASLRVMAGMPLPAVAAVLGHATVAMVEKHYGHLAPGWLRDQVRATALGIGAGEEAEKIIPIPISAALSG